MSFNLSKGKSNIADIQLFNDEVPDRVHWSSVSLCRIDIIFDFVKSVYE